MDIILRHTDSTFRFEFRAPPPSEMHPDEARRLRTVLLRLAAELPDEIGTPERTNGRRWVPRPAFRREPEER